MRAFAFAMLVACSSSSEQTPVEPTVETRPTTVETRPTTVESKRSSPDPVCPKGVNETQAWVYEVFPGCPPPQLAGMHFHCERPCPKPCRMTVEQSGKQRAIAIEYAAGRYARTLDNHEVARACEYDQQVA